ncbi:MAG: hypothetical protein IPM12_07895 [Flavobacteriales bacterium]|nr:hypothetical protein [Flavobacteriales bacterium]
MEVTGSPSKRWPVAGLVLSVAIIGFFLGGFLGRFLAEPADGLAGAATVALAGVVMSALLAVLAGLLCAKRPRRDAVRALVIMGPLAMLLIAWTAFRILAVARGPIEPWQEEQERPQRMRPTDPAATLRFASWKGAVIAAASSVSRDVDMGLGMFSPTIAVGAWPMYAAPDLLDPMHGPTVTDSLIFAQGPYRADIASGPPWFLPAHKKLDYDLLLLRAITLSSDWVEVVVNETDGRTAWVARSQGILRLWPEFIISATAVETLDPAMNPIRVKPLETAAVLADGADALLAPVAVQGDWLQVRTHDLADRIAPTGWIRWRKDGRLLVGYSLLC